MYTCMRWTVPHANLNTEREILKSLIEQFQHILENYQQPTAHQIMSMNNDNMINFYEQLNSFLIEQLHQLQTQLKNFTSDKTYLENHKRKMYAMQIDKQKEYMEEIGPGLCRDSYTTTTTI
jgi:hypothetical protein